MPEFLNKTVVSRRCILGTGHRGDCDVNDFDPPYPDHYARCMKRLYLLQDAFNGDRWVTAREYYDA